MFCAVLSFSGDFNHIKSLVKHGTSLLLCTTFKATHSIAACYLHFAPEENPDYLSHFGM